MPIQAVIFDLGKVLVGFDFQRGYDRIQRLCGYPVEEVRRRIGHTGYVTQLESGQMESREFVRKLGEALGTDFEYGEFCEIWSSIFLPGTLVPESMVVGLKKRYPLVLLSNTNGIHFEMLEREYPILRHFEKRALSHLVGASKPSPLIYEKAVELAGCRPQECFFTDDIPEYVEGARKAGIDAVQFVSAAQLEQELTQRGLRWD
ncbi:MAG TPA: HAD family phosphatase [Bryobacteraceae bacterium]|jgi:putative hydrolase of the HAD superfamily